MKKILIAVDVQNGFVKTDYAEETFKYIRRLMEKRLFDEVIATQYWNEEGSIICRLMNWHDLCTEEEQALRPEISPYVDHITRKNTFSSMNEETTELLKKINGGSLPELVFVLGFDTECCVLATATDLFEMGVRPLVLTRYCGSHDGDVYHKAGIISMDHLIGPDFLIEETINCESDLDEIIERVMR